MKRKIILGIVVVLMLGLYSFRVAHVTRSMQPEQEIYQVGETIQEDGYGIRVDAVELYPMEDFFAAHPDLYQMEMYQETLYEYYSNPSERMRYFIVCDVSIDIECEAFAYGFEANKIKMANCYVEAEATMTEALSTRTIWVEPGMEDNVKGGEIQMRVVYALSDLQLRDAKREQMEEEHLMMMVNAYPKEQYIDLGYIKDYLH